MIDYTSRASIGLVKRIPSGYLRMGSRFHPREEPPHNVVVKEFRIAHVPVTVNQYVIFIKSGGMNENTWWSEEGWAWRQGEISGWGRKDRAQPHGWKSQENRYHHPVTGVTWYEAEAYCKWVSHAKHRKVRLPTEIEWERAARGNDTRPFPWGEEFDPTLANTLESERGTTMPTGRMIRDASHFEVFDMAGNVQEWTSSSYDPLPDEHFTKGTLRVARGGSYNDTAFGCRTSYRRGYPAGYFYPFLGFRVVVSIK
jgi:formylglycine-generating enzyme required for sulfatase activity